MDTTTVSLIVLAILVIAIILRIVWMRQQMSTRPKHPATRPAPAPTRAAPQTPQPPAWFGRFLRRDLLDPAYDTCQLYLEPVGGGPRLTLTLSSSVTLSGSGAPVTCQTATSIADTAQVEAALAAMHWQRTERRTGPDTLQATYARTERAPVQAPPQPDASFDTEAVSVRERSWRDSPCNGQVNIRATGDDRWTTRVGFYEARDGSSYEFEQALTWPQVLKIRADLARWGWREELRHYTDTSAQYVFLYKRP